MSETIWVKSRFHTQLALPLDQHNKLNMILLTMQRRLVIAKTDMEDLIFLTTKVRDLEVELETTKQKIQRTCSNYSD